MKKILYILFISIFIFGMLAGCKVSEEPGVSENTSDVVEVDDTDTGDMVDTDSEETIKVGYTTYLTGTLAAYMGWSRTGVRMAINEINEAGGIGGKQVELIEADISVPDITTKMQRLTELKEQGVVAILTSTSANPAQWASENEIPVIVSNNISTDETIVNFNKYTFFSGLNAWGISKIIALETVGKLGFDNFVYIGVDQACTVDAENLLIYEGQKINPDFEILNSYRMNWDDDKYATVVSTVMSLSEQPDMILQQGGGPTWTGLIQQANMFNMYDMYDIYTDLACEASAAAANVETGDYPYGHVHGTCFFRWWDSEDEGIKEFTDTFHQTSIDFLGEELEPSGAAFTNYLGLKTLFLAIQQTIDNGLDYQNGDVLSQAMSETSWTNFAGEHHYRDFDHQLTYDGYYMTAVDGGEELGHYPISSYEVRFTADEWLPTLEDMKIYAEMLGYPERFAD